MCIRNVERKDFSQNWIYCELKIRVFCIKNKRRGAKKKIVNFRKEWRKKCIFPTAITLTKVVFPLYWRPTSVSSISSFQKRDLNQSKMRLIKANILKYINFFCNYLFKKILNSRIVHSFFVDDYPFF